jgi:hypothetical protein
LALSEPQKKTSTTEHRLVLIDGHIVAQFNQNTGLGGAASWYTCSKANNNDEGDFAVWPLSDANLAKAQRLLNDEYQLIEAPADYTAKQHSDDKWYIHRGNDVDVHNAYESQNMALRNIARSL